MWWTLIAGAGIVVGAGIVAALLIFWGAWTPNAASIIQGVVSKTLYRIITWLLTAGRRQNSDVDICGFWLGQVHAPRGNNVKIYNFYRINGKGCNKEFYIEHFISQNDLDLQNGRVLTLHGKGDFRAPNLSGYYAFDDRYMSKNGTVNFRLYTDAGHMPVLHGRFTQYSNKSTELVKGRKKPVAHEKYSLVKVDVPFARRCRHLFRRRYFRDTTDLMTFFDRLPEAAKELINRPPAMMSSPRLNTTTSNHSDDKLEVERFGYHPNVES